MSCPKTCRCATCGTAPGWTTRPSSFSKTAGLICKKRTRRGPSISTPTPSARATRGRSAGRSRTAPQTRPGQATAPQSLPRSASRTANARAAVRRPLPNTAQRSATQPGPSAGVPLFNLPRMHRLVHSTTRACTRPPTPPLPCPNPQGAAEHIHARTHGAIRGSPAPEMKVPELLNGQHF